jgi:GAF domain-containing protein
MKRRSKVGVSPAKTLRLKGAKAKRLAPKGSMSPSADERGVIARLAHERDEALEQQAATTDILQLISGTPENLQSVFATILENAVRICDASFGDIGQLEDGIIRLLAVHKATPSAFIELRRRTQRVPPASDSPSARILATKVPLHIHDLKCDRAYLERTAPMTVAAVELGGFRTFLGVPLLKKHEVVGLMFLGRQSVRPFTDRQITLVQNFAAQAVIAIENARLLNDLRQRTNDLSESLEQQTATSEVLQVISSSASDLRPVFASMLENAIRLCSANFGGLALLEGDAYRIGAMHNMPPGFAERWQGLIIRPGPLAPVVRAATSKDYVHIGDLSQDAAYIERDPNIVALVDGGHVRTILVVPMLKEQKFVGALSIYRQEKRPFTAKQIELVKNFASQAVIAIENARLLNELRQRTTDLSQRTTELTESLEQQTATSEVLRVISSSQGELQPVFETMLANATSVCQAQFGHLLLCEGDAFRNVAMFDVPIALAEKVRGQLFRPHSESPLAQAAITKEPVQVHDLMVSRPYLDGHPAIVNQVELGGTRTLVAVPMLSAGELVGVIILYRNKVHPFTDKQIELVKNFAAQAVIAIENARLLNELRQSLQQQSATADVLKVISRSAFDLQSVLDTLVGSVAQLCEADMVGIAEQGDSNWRQAASYGFPSEYQEVMARTPIPSGRGSISGRVVLERRTVQIPDVEADPEYELKKAVKVGSVRTILGVPLLREGSPIGVMVLERRIKLPFTDKQIELAETFADQAVIAIENARLLNELRQSLEQQTATADVLRVISSSPGDLEPVFSTMLENAVRICDANFGNIYRWDGDALHLVATCNTPPAFADARRFSFSNRPGPKTVTGRMLASKDLVHVVDTTTEPGYGDKSDPGAVAAVELGGVRTILAVPMWKEDELTGSFTVYRQEVRPFTDKQIELVKNFAAQAVIAIENTRLLNELRQRTDELGQRTTDLTEALEQQTATSEVLQVISRSPGDLEPVFASMLENAVRLCDAKFGIMNFPERGGLRPVATHNVPESFAILRDKVVHFGPKHPLTRAAATKQVVHIPDLELYADEDAVIAKFRKLTGARTILHVPMLKDEELVGIVSIYRQQVRPFTDKQVDLVKTFADQAVIAIENARLLNELRQRTTDLTESLEQQTATSEVLQVISSSPGDLEPVFSTMLESAVRICDATFGNIYRWDGEFLNLVAAHKTPPPFAEARRSPRHPDPKTPVGRMLSTKMAIHIVDLVADQSYIEHRVPSVVAAVELGGVRTLLAVPMLKENELIGLFTVYRQEVDPFTDKQIALVTNFAAQAVIAIENARLLNELRQRTDDLTRSLEDLRTTQDRLVQTQKLASLGQLTAGIAHEIKNPLNFVNNFSGVSVELIDELQEALQRVQADDRTQSEIGELANTLRDNLDKIVQHGRRADAIVKSMLLHSGQSTGEHRSTDINTLVDETLTRAYYNARAEQRGFTIKLERSFDPAAGNVDVFPREITRALLNLISNGFYAATKRKQEEHGEGYEPTLTITTKNLGDRVEIKMRDNGTGIAPEVKEKMFNPFFTTKPAGEGTGLGLSITHDIVVKQHSGLIEVDTKPGEYTEVRIVLPRAAALSAGGRA